MHELRKFVRLMLEGERHIIDVFVRLRVHLLRDHPDEATQSMGDIMVDIRATDGVISVNQLEALSDPDMNGRRYLRLNLRYRDDERRTAERVADDLKAIKGIEKAHIYGFGSEEVDVRV